MNGFEEVLKGKETKAIIYYLLMPWSTSLRVWMNMLFTHS